MVLIKRVAITGTISSGKSTVLSYFRSLGAFTVDADSLLHDAFSIDTFLGQRICELFGTKCILPNGSVDRKYIGTLIAEDPRRAEQLEQVCHPYVDRTLKELYAKLLEQKEKPRLFVAEIPLLFESQCRFTEWFDAICLVDADPKLAKERYLHQGNNQKQFSWRLQRQLPSKEKKKLSHYVVENNGSLEELYQKTKQLFQLLSV